MDRFSRLRKLPLGPLLVLIIVVLPVLGLMVLATLGRHATPVFSQINSGLSKDGGGSYRPTSPQSASGASGSDPQAGQPAAAEQPAASPVAENAIFSSDPNRKIIKNGDLSIEVENLDVALSRIGGGAAQLGGYVLETRTDFDDGGARSAVIQLAVPVEQFEVMLQRIRELGTVGSEQSSGTDVSQEYVDLQSQLANLEATRARVRQFLEQAQSVEEALQVNAQLTELEGQISQIKGRLQYISQRAAYSTITVQLHQTVPATTPTPTPIAAPTWDPAKTAGQAYSTLSVIIQALVSVGIWLAIVVLPLVLPLALAWWAVRAYRRGGRRQPGAK